MKSKTCLAAGHQEAVSGRQSGRKRFWGKLTARKPRRAKNSTARCACTATNRPCFLRKAADPSTGRPARTVGAGNFSKLRKFHWTRSELIPTRPETSLREPQIAAHLKWESFLLAQGCSSFHKRSLTRHMPI